MGFIWALTQFPMIGSVGVETLVAGRIALGAGEGPATPVALHSAYKWFPNELRTLPTAVIVQGGAIGVMVALTGSLCVGLGIGPSAHSAWPASFGAHCGSASAAGGRWWAGGEKQGRGGEHPRGAARPHCCRG